MQDADKFGHILNEIRQIPLFSFLTETELNLILARAEVVNYQKGETIISQGEVGEHLFAIVGGSAQVSINQFGGDELRICRIKKGEVFGEAAIFLAEKRMATITSLGATTAVRIHRKELMAFIRKDPMAGNKILMIIIYGLIKKLREANQEIAFEKQMDMSLDDLDSLIKDFLKDI